MASPVNPKSCNILSMSSFGKVTVGHSLWWFSSMSMMIYDKAFSLVLTTSLRWLSAKLADLLIVSNTF